MHWAWLLAVVLMMAAQPAGSVVRIGLEDFQGPDWSLHGVSATLDTRASARLDIAEARFFKQQWRNIAVRCAKFEMSAQFWRCHGELTTIRQPLQIEYRPSTQVIQIQIGSGETQLKIEGSMRGPLSFELQRWPLADLSKMLPNSPWTVGSGRLSAHGQWQNPQRRLIGEIHVTDAAFSNTDGSQAGDKLNVTGNISATMLPDQWQWSTEFRWDQGELFWSPLYIARGDVRWVANGRFKQGVLDVENAVLDLGTLAQAKVTASYSATANRLLQAKLQVDLIDLPAMYSDYLKPMLAGSMVGYLELEGQGQVEAEWSDGALQSARLSLNRVNLADRAGRFAAYGLNLQLPWRRSQPEQARLSWAAADMLKLPLGKVDAAIRIKPQGITVPDLDVPVADGRLQLHDIKLDWSLKPWNWGLSAELTPTNFEALTLAVGTTPVSGKLAAVIPSVSGKGGDFEVGGAILLKAFDGTLVIQNLHGADLLGKAPRAFATIDGRNLDLGQLTSTYSFGRIEGRVDMQVNGLQLVNWLPTEMDLQIQSSAGEYRRKISQRAVENISSLGGAGAAAALQRSFLRFFGEFGYARLGLGCHLVLGVCAMSGVSDQTQGYVLVEGAGIPAITVLGYNRRVSWTELVDRLKAAMSSNRAPVIQ